MDEPSRCGARSPAAPAGRAPPGRVSEGRASAGRAEPGRAPAERASPGRASAGRVSAERTTPGRASLGRASAERVAPGLASAGRAPAWWRSPGWAAVGRSVVRGSGRVAGPAGRTSERRAGPADGTGRAGGPAGWAPGLPGRVAPSGRGVRSGPDGGADRCVGAYCGARPGPDAGAVRVCGPGWPGDCPGAGIGRSCRAAVGRDALRSPVDGWAGGNDGGGAVFRWPPAAAGTSGCVPGRSSGRTAPLGERWRAKTCPSGVQVVAGRSAVVIGVGAPSGVTPFGGSAPATVIGP